MPLVPRTVCNFDHPSIIYICICIYLLYITCCLFIRLKYISHYVLLNAGSVLQFEAAAVNLIAGEKPADVYSEIAARYNSIIIFML